MAIHNIIERCRDGCRSCLIRTGVVFVPTVLQKISNFFLMYIMCLLYTAVHKKQGNVAWVVGWVSCSPI